ncbi:MAG: prepilin-type N-terminal cleavage/methylation domain-containing protein [Thermoguttaceae bacterium]|nr:prepilin-type N-terminal cleavage/methylation domain-containing protein [Thermoguttaceae bacterium]
MSKLIQSCRQGFSLLEVLVSVFVVLIGLLGVATMIPAGRYEILQARKADMGADLSRAIMNSVVTQISNGWNPGGSDYYFVANDSGNLATKLKTGLGPGKIGLSEGQTQIIVNDNRMFNGDDDVAIMEGDNNQFQLALDASNQVIGTGAYTACATIVSLGNGYYEVTGLAVYRYSDLAGTESDATDYKRGSYIFCADGSGKQRWYKIENINPGSARAGTTITTAAGDVNTKTTTVKYLGDVIGISRKVVRIDTYPTTGN